MNLNITGRHVEVNTPSRLQPPPRVDLIQLHANACA